MSRAPLPRSKSLVLPEIVNPFVHHLELTWLDKLQFALMTVTVVPLRLLLIVLCLFLAWGLAYLALLGHKDAKEPMKGWRKSFARPVLAALGRITYFATGFHKITIKGEQASAEQAPIIVAGPHSTFFDAVVMFVSRLPSGVSRIENGKILMLGTLTKFTQPVFVSREDPNSRQNTIKEIRRRAQSNGAWPQVVIFPEGTCTNRSCLISYKPGAFIPGVPVQPVCVRYLNKLDTVTWTWEGIDALHVLWYTLCQFNNKVEIEFLPVYRPSPEEIADPILYGRNVRQLMSKALGVPMTDHTYEDIRLMNYAAKLDMPAAAGLVEFTKLSKKLGMTFDNMKELLDRYCSIAHSNKGHVTIEEFAAHLQLPVTDALQQMFELYDRDGSGSMDFREYIIGMSLVAMPANTEETIELAFKVFDQGGKGYIVVEELADILWNAFGMDRLDGQKIFEQVDTDRDGKIHYDEFKAYAEIRPEYASLFTKYRELHAGDSDAVEETLDSSITPENIPHQDTNGIGVKVKAINGSEVSSRVTSTLAPDINGKEELLIPDGIAQHIKSE